MLLYISKFVFGKRKSAVSGFFSGTTLGLPWAKNLQGVLTAGGISGSIGEVVNQVFDNAYGNDKGFSLTKTLISGGIGFVANFLSGSVVDKINNVLDQQLTEKIAETQTSSYKETIKKAILAKSPRIGTNQLKKTINKNIQEVQNLLKKQTELNKAAAKQAIERGIDYLQDQTNQIINTFEKKDH